MNTVKQENLWRAINLVKLRFLMLVIFYFGCTVSETCDGKLVYNIGKLFIWQCLILNLSLKSSPNFLTIHVAFGADIFNTLYITFTYFAKL